MSSMTALWSATCMADSRTRRSDAARRNRDPQLHWVMRFR